MKVAALIRGGLGGGAVLTLVVSGTALVVVDMTIVAIGLPAIGVELGAGPGAIEWVVVSYLLTLGAVTQIVGSLSDRLGRRRVYLAGLAIFGLTSLACGLAPGLEQLVAGRIGQGVGAAVLMAGGLPLLSQRYQGEARNLAIATWGSASTAAGLVAPLLGGLLVDGFGWRAVFLINVPICVVVGIAAARLLPADTRPDGPRAARLDWAGTALLVGALALLGYGLLRGEQQGWSSPLTLCQLGGGLGLLLVFLLVERRAANPVLDPAMFRRRAFTGAALAVFLSRMLTIGATVYFVRYFQEALGLTPTASGLLLAPVFVAQMSFGILGAKLLSRFKPGHVIASGFVVKGVGAAGLALVVTPTVSPWVLVAPLVIWGVGGGIAGSPVIAVAMNVTEPSRAGMVAGTISTLASIGAGVGTALLGLVYQAGSGADANPAAIASATSAVLLCSAVLAVVAAAAALGLISRGGLAEPRRASAQSVTDRSAP